MIFFIFVLQQTFKTKMSFTQTVTIVSRQQLSPTDCEQFISQHPNQAATLHYAYWIVQNGMCDRTYGLFFADELTISEIWQIVNHFICTRNDNFVTQTNPIVYWTNPETSLCNNRARVQRRTMSLDSSNHEPLFIKHQWTENANEFALAFDKVVFGGSLTIQYCMSRAEMNKTIDQISSLLIS